MSAMNLMHSPSGPNIYTLKVIATDMGTDPMVMSGTATVVVTIQVSFCYHCITFEYQMTCTYTKVTL